MPGRSHRHAGHPPRQTGVTISSIVATLLTFAGCSAAFASLEDYPFHLVTKARGGRAEVIAENKGPSPVSLCMKHAGIDVSPDNGQSEVVVVPPNTSLPLGSVQAWTADYSYYVGRINAVPDPQARYRLPFGDGLAFPITQAYGGPLTSHDNDQNRYAVDFAMPEGTPIVAAREGVVVDVTLGHHSHGRTRAFWRKANTVTIVHDDGTIAEYAHLAPGTPLVQRGQRVDVGTLVGYSGNTGYSSGPHLHFAVSNLVMRDGKVAPVSIPFLFYTDAAAAAFSPAMGMTATAVYATSLPRTLHALRVLRGASDSSVASTSRKE